MENNVNKLTIFLIVQTRLEGLSVKETGLLSTAFTERYCLQYPDCSMHLILSDRKQSLPIIPECFVEEQK